MNPTSAKHRCRHAADWTVTAAMLALLFTLAAVTFAAGLIAVPLAGTFWDEEMG